MTDLVDPTEIERIVGTSRKNTLHCGRAVSAEQTVYILHSRECVDSGIDLRECAYSEALDRGIEMAHWEDRQDQTVVLSVRAGRLYARRPGAVLR